MASENSNLYLGIRIKSSVNVSSRDDSNFLIVCTISISDLILHTVAAPAVRSAVKTELSYQNDTIRANAKIALASPNS